MFQDDCAELKNRGNHSTSLAKEPSKIWQVEKIDYISYNIGDLVYQKNASRIWIKVCA